MNEQPRANKSKTLTIQSAPKTPTFNLKVGTIKSFNMVLLNKLTSLELLL